MIENLIVILIVCAVTALAVRSLYRTLSGKSAGCGCGDRCSTAGTGCEVRPTQIQLRKRAADDPSRSPDPERG